MGNAMMHSGGAVKLSREERRIVKKFSTKFSDTDMALLARVFKQLAVRSPNATVDPEHFAEYVCFPGLHGEQVFRAFDSKKTGNLDFEEFVTGLARSARGTKAEKVKFLFEIYDLKGDGYVWKHELQKMVNQMPRETFKHDDDDALAAVTRGSRDHRFVGPTPTSSAENQGSQGDRGGDQEDSGSVGTRETQEEGDDPTDLREAGRDPHAVGVATHRFATQKPGPVSSTASSKPRALDPSKPKPRAPLAPRASDSRLVVKDHHEEDKDMARRQHRRHTTPVSSGKSAGRFVACTNDDVADRAFETSDWNRDGRLSFEQFEHWVDTVPEVLQFVDTIFEHAMRTADKDFSAAIEKSSHAGKIAPPQKLTSPVRSEIALPPDSAASAASDGERRFLGGASRDADDNNTELAPTTPDAATADDDKEVKFEGQLSKVGAMTHHVASRYFVLVGNCLYYYLKKGDSKPKGLVFLGGCQVEPIKKSHLFPPYKHGFRIVHLDAERLGQRQHTLYAASAEARDAWVNALVRAISSPRWSRKNGAFDVTEYYDLGEELGSGRFAVARKAVDRSSGRKVAVKSIEKRASLYQRENKDAPQATTPATGGAGVAAPAQGGALGVGQGQQALAPAKDQNPELEESKEGPLNGDDGQQPGDEVPEDDDNEQPEGDAAQQQPPNAEPLLPYDENRAKDEREMFRREIAVMRLARHDSVLPLLAVFEDRTHVHLVTPLMDCDLASYMRKRQAIGAPTDERDARVCVPVILEAVAYLHHLGVAHRDLKPDNILMEDADDLRKLRLADFSISQILKPDETSNKVAGSVEYMAPEIFLKKGAGFPADVWAVGVIALLVLFYRQPFGWGESKAETIGAILDRELDPDLDWSTCSAEAKDLFVDKMLVTDPEQRITAQDALETHPWSLKAQGGVAKRTGFDRSNSEPTWLSSQVSEVSGQHSGAKPSPPQGDEESSS